MKKFLIVSIIALSSLIAQAQSVFTSTIAGAGTSVLLAFPATIESVTVTGTGAAASVTMFDNSVATLTFTNAAHTIATTFPTNITTIITASTGRQQTNVFTGLFTTTVSVPAGTVNLPAIGAFASGASVATQYDTALNPVRGLIATASGACVVSVVYRRLN